MWDVCCVTPAAAANMPVKDELTSSLTPALQISQDPGPPETRPPTTIIMQPQVHLAVMIIIIISML